MATNRQQNGEAMGNHSYLYLDLALKMIFFRAKTQIRTERDLIKPKLTR